MTFCRLGYLINDYRSFIIPTAAGIFHWVPILSTMVVTYFKRFRMECSLPREKRSGKSLPNELVLMPWTPSLLRDHALVKYESFRNEIDANVFPCLAKKDGCRDLMKELSNRKDFTPEATWLAVVQSEIIGRWIPVGTIQGIRSSSYSGAIQNLGIVREYRGKGVGSALLNAAMDGFETLGCKQVNLEVTVQNSAAIRLYESLGFHKAQIVFKVSDVPFQ